MTVLLGRKHVGVALKYNQGGSASINNQDKTITENGVYTADEGYTGLGTVVVEVQNNGEIVTAINKTGSAVNVGDKVWLSENVKTGNTYFLTGTATTDGSQTGVISTTGLSAVISRSLYTISNDGTVTNIKSSGRFSNIYYVGDYVLGNYSTDSTQVLKSNDCLTLKGKYIPIENSDNLFAKRQDTNHIYKIDLETGDIVQTWTGGSDINALGDFSWAYQIGNSVVVGSYVFDLNDDYTITNQRSVKGFSTNGQAYLTKDNNHLVTEYGDEFKVYRIIDAENVELLKDAVSEDLKNLSDLGSFVYNRNNDVITAVIGHKNTEDCIIAKYNNGKIQRLNVTFPFTGGVVVSGATYKYFYGHITFTNDMSRALLTLSTGSACRQVIVDFTGSSGYAVVPYKTYATSQDSITGIANSTAESGEAVEILINGTINEDITITENGEYEPSSLSTGFSKVTVNVANNSSSIIMQKFNGQCHCILPDSTTGIVDGFTADKYIVFPATITDGCVMTFKIETGDDITSFQNFYLGMFEGYVSESIIGIWIGYELMVAKINPNTIYYVKVRIEDSILYASYSLDGVEYSDEVSGSIDLTDPAYSENRLGVGLYSNRYFRGKIHLNGCYIEKFGYPVWKPFMNIQQMNGYIYNYQSVYGENFQILGTNGDITYTGDLYIPIKPSVQPGIDLNPND